MFVGHDGPDLPDGEGFVGEFVQDVLDGVDSWRWPAFPRSTSSGGSPASPACGTGRPPVRPSCSRPLPASPATAASSMTPSSLANRIAVPEALSTTCGRPSMMTRSPALIPSAPAGPLIPPPGAPSRPRPDVITFQPGLEPHMLRRGRRPPQPGEMRGPLRPVKRLHGCHLLEPLSSARR